MNWKEATLSQLYVIVFDDPMANNLDRQIAAQEIAERNKRKRKPYRTEHIKVKAAYK